MNLFDKIIENYRIHEQIGSGSIGTIYRGQHIIWQDTRAIKIFHRYSRRNVQFESSYHATLLQLRSVDHDTILRPELVSKAPMSGYTIQPFAKAPRSLQGLLRSYDDFMLAKQREQLLKIILQSAIGLAEANEQAGIVHGNLKPSNILLFSTHTLDESEPLSYTAKLSDFVGAVDIQVYQNPRNNLESYRESWCYACAPELFDAKQSSHQSDIYALGMILYRAMVGQCPFQIHSFDEARHAHLNQQVEPPAWHRPEMTASLARLILQCLENDPSKRPNARYVATSIQEEIVKLSKPEANYTNLSPEAIERRLVPALEVRDGQGVVLKTLPLSGEGILVGSTPGGSTMDRLPLPDSEIEKEQAEIIWDGHTVSLTNLVNNGKVALGTNILPIHTPTVWDWDSIVQMGTSFLQIQRPIDNAGLDANISIAHIGAAIRVQRDTDTHAAPHISMWLATDKIQLTPGRPTTFMVRLDYIVDLKRIQRVDNLLVHLEGALTHWVEPSEHRINLNPGDSQTGTFTVHIPLTSACVAGRYPMIVRAISSVGLGVVESTITLIVLTFRRSVLHLQPHRRQSRDPAHYTAHVENTGNITTAFSLSADDDEQALNYHFADQQVYVRPGEVQSVDLTVSSERWLFLGTPRQRSFTVISTPNTTGFTDGSLAIEVTKQSEQAVFEQLPQISGCMLLLLGLSVLSCILGTYLYGLFPKPFQKVVQDQALYSILAPSRVPATPFPAFVFPTTLAITDTSTPTVTLILTSTTTLSVTITPTQTLQPTMLPTQTPTAVPTSLPVPTLPAVIACPPRYLPMQIFGGGGIPGERFIVYFDERPVGGGTEVDVVDANGYFKALLVIGSEQPGLHVISIIQGGRSILQLTCFLGEDQYKPTPTVTATPIPTPGEVPPGSSPTPIPTATPTLSPTPETPAGLPPTPTILPIVIVVPTATPVP